MADTKRNNLQIYDDVAQQWWSDDIRWVRTLKNMVPGRLSWFDRFIDWQGKRVLDVGCAGGFMAEALNERGAQRRVERDGIVVGLAGLVELQAALFQDLSLAQPQLGKTPLTCTAVENCLFSKYCSPL